MLFNRQPNSHTVFLFVSFLIMSSTEPLVSAFPQCYDIPAELESYDFNRSTEDNYKMDKVNNQNEFVGEFIEHRKTLDYNYHAYYNPERQLFQDTVIKHFLKTYVKDVKTNLYCARPTAPWVVFTAGAMGAGKSHAMKWLASHKYFPLESFVMVDPDQIRYQLPEMSGYLYHNPTTAGSLTHKESGYIQEILTLEALKQGKNVLIDGSLRNASWNKILISRIYHDNMNVKIAIVHVSASEDEVMKRARKRALSTGRVVPEDILLKTLKEVPIAVKELSPLVDYSVTLNTDNMEPVIESTSESMEDWESFAQRWLQECSATEGVSNKDEVYSIHFHYTDNVFPSVIDPKGKGAMIRKCVDDALTERNEQNEQKKNKSTK